MKKKWVVATLISALAITIVVVLLFALLSLYKQLQGTAHTETQSISITENCWEYVTDCQIIEQDNGTVSVTLTAPDYVQLVAQIAEETTGRVTAEMIAEAVKNSPQMVKEYSFVAKTGEDEDVKVALIEQISYELLAVTLKDING